MKSSTSLARRQAMRIWAMSCSFLSVIAIEVSLECGELTDYRTLWRPSQPLAAARMRVFADCPAARRAAAGSGARLESRQIGVLYSLAKSTSKCRISRSSGSGIAVEGLRHARLRTCRIASRRNQGAGRAEQATFRGAFARRVRQPA
jgi:hypothetical protein